MPRMSIETLIQDALEWGRLGNKHQARALLAQAVQQEPSNARAWFLLSQTLEKDAEALDCLRRVDELQPGNPQVQARIAEIEERLATPTMPVNGADWHRPLSEQMPWVSRGEPATPPHGLPPVRGPFAWEAAPKTAANVDWNRPFREQTIPDPDTGPEETVVATPNNPASPVVGSQGFAPPSKPDRSNWAKAALVIGIIGLATWCLPICGLPIALVGFVLGVISRTSRRRDLATAAIGLCVIVLVLSCVSGVFEGYLFWMNRMPPTP